MNEKTVAEKKSNDDIDISDFLRLIGRGLKQVGLFFKWVFVSVYELIIALFIFIKRKFIWLALAAALGVGYGIYAARTPLYTSSMTVRSGLNNSYFLYGQVEYFNALIRNGRTNELSKEFNITPEEAGALRVFSISPVKNDIEDAKIYRETFLTFRRNHNVGYDTMWSKNIRFKDFQKTLSEKDYPIQIITVNSKNQDIYGKVQDGFIKSINSNPVLAERRNAEAEIRKQEEELLTKSLQDIDTLRQVYNRKLMTEASSPSTGSQLVLGDKNPRNPELDLYDKSLIIKDELIEAKRRSVAQKEIVDIYSGFGKVGTRKSTMKLYLKFSLYGFIAAFVILIGIEFLRFLIREEKSKSLKRSTQSA